MTETTELKTIKAPSEADFIVTTTPEKIKGLQERYKDLKLAGTEYVNGKVIVVDADLMLADSDGLAKIKDAAKDAMKHRTKCASEHKKLKEDTLAEGRRLDAWKNEATAKIVAVENRLNAMEKAVEDELAAMVTRQQDELQKNRELRIGAIGGIPDIIRSTMMPNFLRVATDEAFSDFVSQVQAMNLALAEQAKAKAAKEEADRIEAKRLADEKAESNRLQKLADEELRATNARVAKEQAERQKALDEQADFLAKEKAKVDEANKKLADAEALAKREAEEKIEADRKALYEGDSRTSWRFSTPVGKKGNSLESDIAMVRTLIAVVEQVPRPVLTSFHKASAESEIKNALTDCETRLKAVLAQLEES